MAPDNLFGPTHQPSGKHEHEETLSRSLSGERGQLLKDLSRSLPSRIPVLVFLEPHFLCPC